MRFDPSSDQERVQAEADAFLEDPASGSVADADRLRQVPRELISRAARRGLTAIAVPRDWGGAGADEVAVVRTIERLARWNASVALTLGLSNLAASVLVRFGTPHQTGLWVRKIASGEISTALALGDSEHPRLTRDQDGGFSVNGRIRQVPNGRVAALALLDVPSRSNGSGQGGMWAVALDSSGVERIMSDETIGAPGAAWADLDFHGVRLDPAGPIGGATEVALTARSWTVERTRILCAALTVGIGRASVQRAATALRHHASQGTQGVHFMLADSAAELDAAWMLTVKAAAGGRVVDASMARLAAAESAERAVDRTIQIVTAADRQHLAEMERLSRDVRAGDMLLGPAYVERRHIARSIIHPA